MSTLIQIILANLLVSSISLVGIITILSHPKRYEKILLWLVALSAGTMIGAAFLHLLPESVEVIGVNATGQYIILSILIFLIIEKLLHWRHCHEDHCHTHTFGYMNLFGDTIHNFLDGALIAGAFITNPNLGWLTTLAIVLHEIPQEIGDFGVLLYAGFSRTKAILLNLFVSLTAVSGGIIGFYLTSQFPLVGQYFVPLAAGGFIYIAISDLIPEIRQDPHRQNSTISIAFMLLGLLIMFLSHD